MVQPSFAVLDRPDSDVVLMSSDKVNFHVHTLVLSIASPVFNNMFSAMQKEPPTPPVIRCQDIIRCTEDSTTLQLLLWHCYPFPDSEPVIPDFATLTKVLEAAQKYYMGRVIANLESVYLNLGSESIKTQPVAAYTLSCRLNWPNLKESALKAALLFSHKSVLAQLEACDPQPSTQDSLKLLQYHLKCCATTRDFLKTQFIYKFADIDGVKSMLEKKGPMSIIQHLEENVARCIAQGFVGVPGEVIVTPRRLRNHLSAVVARCSDFVVEF